MWQVGNIVHYIWYKMYVLVVFYCLRCNTIPTIGFRQVINAKLRTCCAHCASKEAGHKMNIRFKALPPSPSQPAQYTGKEQEKLFICTRTKINQLQK